MNQYVIEGGAGGNGRLALLSRVLAPTTGRFLDELGLRDGMTCLDAGCGGGQVTMEIARRVGPSGSVVGIDRDEVIVSLARQAAVEANVSNVRYLALDVGRAREAGAFDVVYSRFLLSHLNDVQGALTALLSATKLGGIVAVEDIDFTGHFCHPPCPAFDRYIGLYRELVRRKGGDADLGPKLTGLFLDAGLEDVRVQVVQPAALQGEVKSLAGVTLEKIATGLIQEGLLAAAELPRLLAELEAYAKDPQTIQSSPRLFQVCGKKR